MFQSINMALVIVRCPFKSTHSGKWLAVNSGGPEKGWWMPGGASASGEDFKQSAERVCREQTGISVEVKGLLRVDQAVKDGSCRMSMTFYAEPVNA